MLAEPEHTFDYRQREHIVVRILYLEESGENEPHALHITIEALVKPRNVIEALWVFLSHTLELEIDLNLREYPVLHWQENFFDLPFQDIDTFLMLVYFSFHGLVFSFDARQLFFHRIHFAHQLLQHALVDLSRGLEQLLDVPVEGDVS